MLERIGIVCFLHLAMVVNSSFQLGRNYANTNGEQNLVLFFLKCQNLVKINEESQMPIIVRRNCKEDQGLQTSLGYTHRSCFKSKQNNKQN